MHLTSLQTVISPIKNDAHKLFIVESNEMISSDVIMYVFNFTIGYGRNFSNQANDHVYFLIPSNA